MAKAELKILELLKDKPEGLEFFEIYEHLDQDDGLVSERAVRNLLNKMVKENQLVKRKPFQKRLGRGAPGYLYFHPDAIPQQLSIFENIQGIKKFTVTSRNKMDQDLLDPEENKRREKSVSVLENIAQGHLKSESYAQAIIKIAPQLAKEDPIELVLKFTNWIVKDIENTANELKKAWEDQDKEILNTLTFKCEHKLIFARHFRDFWRFDRSEDEVKGILDLPGQAKNIYKGNQKIKFDENKARKILEQRIIGNQFVEIIDTKDYLSNSHKIVSGTDASVADLLIAHARGSFIRPEPLIVTNSAASMIVNESTNKETEEYQDFDIFPESLQAYTLQEAVFDGLIISPQFMTTLGGGNYFERSKPLAMDLRQYWQDYNVAMKQAKWRPIGNAGELTRKTPSLIFRDGRIFPVEHRLNPYENNSLYGKIVRNQIEKFKEVIYNTIAKPIGKIVYAGVVKNPELCWLSPLVFWYLHDHEKAITVDDIYNSPFTDTAVAHLLFLGLAHKLDNLDNDQSFCTFQVIRHFCDIAFIDEFPFLIEEENETKPINENSIKDWQKYIEQRLQRRKNEKKELILELDDYNPFIYSCACVGTLMFYTSPLNIYKPLISDESSGHFLIPRLEIAINFEEDYTDEEKLKEYQSQYKEDIKRVLAWLSSGHWGIDRRHTQSSYEYSKENFPILIPDATIIADEVATFSRDRLGQEIHDEIRRLIVKRISDGNFFKIT